MTNEEDKPKTIHELRELAKVELMNGKVINFARPVDEMKPENEQFAESMQQVFDHFPRLPRRTFEELCFGRWDTSHDDTELRND